MDRAEFNRRLEQISIDHQATMSRIASAQPGAFSRLFEAADEAFVQAHLALQREAGIKTPVTQGRTE